MRAKKVIFRYIFFQQIFSQQVLQAWCYSKRWAQQWVKESPFSCSRQSKGYQGAVSQLGFFFFFLIFIYLTGPGLSCGMWDLVPRPEITPRSPAWGAWSLSHWISRQFLSILFLKCKICSKDSSSENYLHSQYLSLNKK